MARKKVTKVESEPELSRAELKQKIAELELRYKESFKGNSCKEIMDSYQALTAARKKYNKACKKASDELHENQVMDEVIKQMSSED